MCLISQVLLSLFGHHLIFTSVTYVLFVTCVMLTRRVCGLYYYSMCRMHCAYIKLVQAFKVVLLDLGDVIVLEIDQNCVFRNLLRNRNQTCWHKCTYGTRIQTLIRAQPTSTYSYTRYSAVDVPQIHRKPSRVPLWCRVVIISLGQRLQRHLFLYYISFIGPTEGTLVST